MAHNFLSYCSLFFSLLILAFHVQISNSVSTPESRIFWPRFINSLSKHAVPISSIPNYNNAGSHHGATAAAQMGGSSSGDNIIEDRHEHGRHHYQGGHIIGSEAVIMYSQTNNQGGGDVEHPYRVRGRRGLRGGYYEARKLTGPNKKVEHGHNMNDKSYGPAAKGNIDVYLRKLTAALKRSAPPAATDTAMKRSISPPDGVDSAVKPSFSRSTPPAPKGK